MNDHLVIPDEHAYPEDNFRRFEALGNYIIETKPKVIIRLGDCWDMGSLCSYDKGKKSFMFKNIQDDIESGHAAEALIFEKVLKHNETMSKWKKGKYEPTVIKLLGNHEIRLAKLLETEPRWEGTISMDSFRTRLNIKEQMVDYLNYTVVDGVAYSHFFVSGVMGRAFTAANTLISKRCMSCTMGHTHTLDAALSAKPTGERIRGLIAGSFHDPEHRSFAGSQVDNIWSNLIVHKREVNNGDYDMEEVSVNRLLKEYL